MQYPVTRILVEDPQGNWIPDDLLFSAPGALDYPHNLFTQSTGVSGEIKIFWDTVTGAAGYNVYYGTASQIYNASGSPLDVQDGNASQGGGNSASHPVDDGFPPEEGGEPEIKVEDIPF